MAIKSLEKTNLRKKLKGFFSWTQQIDIEVKNFFATCFDLYRLLESVTYFHWAHKIQPDVSKLNKLSKEYISPQKTQKGAVFFYFKELGLVNDLKVNKFKKT